MGQKPNDDWWSDDEESVPSTEHGGPFGIPPVDPLVYRPVIDDDSPELRASAAYVAPTPRLHIREARPAKPPSRSFMSWVPGWNRDRDTSTETNEGLRKTGVPSFVGWVIVGVLCIIPIVLGWFIISFALNFYNT